jgi:hypothetical protein
MNIRTRIKTILREHYGEFNSYLEHEYENKITNYLVVGDDEERQAWVTYNQVMLEFKHNLNDRLKVEELQYLLTEDSDPNNNCLTLLETVQIKTPELERLYHKIKNF